MKKNIFIDLISCLFIILFLYTGGYKLMDLSHFKWVLSVSPLLKHTYVLVADILPPLEILIALLLLIPFFSNTPQLRKWGLYGSVILMTIFTTYVGYMLAFRDNDRPCSCGGIIAQMNWHQHLYFNTLFTCLGILAVWLNNRQNRKDREGIAIA